MSPLHAEEIEGASEEGTRRSGFLVCWLVLALGVSNSGKDAAIGYNSFDQTGGMSIDH